MDDRRAVRNGRSRDTSGVKFALVKEKATVRQGKDEASGIESSRPVRPGRR